jgi:hypothetical protein
VSLKPVRSHLARVLFFEATKSYDQAQYLYHGDAFEHADRSDLSCDPVATTFSPFAPLIGTLQPPLLAQLRFWINLPWTIGQRMSLFGLESFLKRIGRASCGKIHG